MRSRRSAPTLAAAIVTVAFLGAVIGGVGAPLITSVALDLDVPLTTAQWTLTVTLFVGAITAPVLGRLGTGPHRRRALLTTLLLVAVGGLLTTIPGPLSVLLLGRALQGLSLGAVALLMSIARDHLPAQRATATIATVSVASTVGIGVAYPLMGLLDQLAGLRTAYAVGFVLCLVAAAVAAWAIPPDPPRPTVRVDVPGAVLLGIGVLGVLLAVAQPALWQRPELGATVLVVAAAALAAWVAVERRTRAPLVDLAQFTRPTMVRANIAMATSGIAMYLLFALLTRYVQTPPAAGYGFGLTQVAAGAALIPFSVLGFVAGRYAPRLAARLGTRSAFTGFALAVATAAALFLVGADSLAGTVAAMAVLGFGVGGVSAIMPKLVLDGISTAETASVLAINQIVRSVGFSIGSALAGLILATQTPRGSVLPDEHGYPFAAAYVFPLVVLSCVVIAARARRRS